MPKPGPGPRGRAGLGSVGAGSGVEGAGHGGAVRGTRGAGKRIDGTGRGGGIASGEGSSPTAPQAPSPGDRPRLPLDDDRPRLLLDLDKLLAARLQAVRARPYLATALFALHPVASRSVPTMAVDRHWRCYASPAFVERTPVEELAAVWVHEVSHLLRDHHGRSDRVTRARELTAPGDRLRMNIAADCEINDDAFGDGLVEPEGAVTPRRLGLRDGELMEDYLRQFRLGPRTAGFTWLDCGSGADGRERAWDLGPDGAHGLNAQERDAVRFRVAQGLSSRPGNAPEGWQRWAEEVFHPPQPWRELLGAAIRSAAAGTGAGDDYSYGRPSRRSASVPGAVLPSLRRVPPRVTVVIDTSGSVSDAELGSALLEAAAIARAVGGRRDLVTVLSCDAATQAVHTLCRAEGIPLVGGGGTDLRTGFATAQRARPRPDVIVALTDGHTPWPSARPAARTVVGLFDRPYERSSRYLEEDDPDYVPTGPPDWARVVHIG
ncbi:VWA-like domain-containing protein [Streptomyces sp. NPDC088745]|uniref:vWA domain-containing protein n=1 Tax=Streptomyces sp. NPDC088745 TaxID=3365884 RepID=UPI0037FA2976